MKQSFPQVAEQPTGLEEIKKIDIGNELVDIHHLFEEEDTGELPNKNQEELTPSTFQFPFNNQALIINFSNCGSL